MIERTFDADYINTLINHPSILPWVSFPGQKHVDLAPFVADSSHYALRANNGAFFFQRLSPGVYEAHSLFLPEGRGRAALNAGRAAMAFMFGNTDCHTILARCPDGNRAVLGFTRALRFEFLGTEPKAWPTDAGPVDERWFQMTRDRWSSLYGE